MVEQADVILTFDEHKSLTPRQSIRPSPGVSSLWASSWKEDRPSSVIRMGKTRLFSRPSTSKSSRSSTISPRACRQREKRFPKAAQSNVKESR